MTDSEMRQRLAEAMGWTDIITPGERPRMGEDVTGMPPEGHRPGYRTEIPDPLESDRDAALLRAWCLEQGWEIRSTIHPLWAVSTIHTTGLRHARIGTCTVMAQTEPDPCRRERLALCRAVLQAIEAQP